MDFESLVYRRILSHYPTGVCVITAMQEGGAPIGMVVGSFTSVSLDPPLVGFFPDRRSTSWPRIAATNRFCVNILADDQMALCKRFASRDDDKFRDISHRFSDAGLPILDGVVAWIDCTVNAVHEAGDHFIALGEVQALAAGRDARPLVFWQGGYGHFAPMVG